ncbi:hypothetical protein, partial [Pseudomonas syringae]|uniref:hypothetical protein n=1 Tax=Pseudomonas syringae TaxID=317 RepID=UPI001F412287
SGLFREGAGTSAKNVSSGMKPSRTSSLPQGVAFSLPMQFWGRINCFCPKDVGVDLSAKGPVT